MLFKSSSFIEITILTKNVPTNTWNIKIWDSILNAEVFLFPLLYKQGILKVKHTDIHSVIVAESFKTPAGSFHFEFPSK